MLFFDMHLLGRIANLLYPSTCSVCRAHPSVSALALCSACIAAVPRGRAPMCRICGISCGGAFDADIICRRCRKRPPAFDRGFSPWQYSGVMREIIRQFKYLNRWRLGHWLADHMAILAERSLSLSDIHLVVPMPAHWLKSRLTGLQPTVFLAQRLSRSLGKPCHTRALARTRWTPTQTSLSTHERFRNVNGAFKARITHVEGRGILLVDDVLTSGATADAASAALKAAGAVSVFVVTAARTPLAWKY